MFAFQRLLSCFSLPIYFKPRMIAIELALFYFGHGHYSDRQYQQEIASLPLPLLNHLWQEPYSVVDRAFESIKLQEIKTAFVDLDVYGKLVFYVNQRFGIRKVGVQCQHLFQPPNASKVKRIKDVRFQQKIYQRRMASASILLFNPYQSVSTYKITPIYCSSKVPMLFQFQSY